MKKLWDWAWDLYGKHEEGINYLIFGFLAFVLNYVLYFVFASTLHMHYMAATALSWVLTVVFAYWTNRSFVFKSKVKGKEGIWKEFSAFVGARIVTGGMELVIMYVMVDLAGIHNMIAKFVCNVVVIVSNYIFSKLLVFKKKEA